MSDSLRKQARGAFLKGQFTSAEILYSQFIELGGEDMGAFLHLAICREISGDLVSANELYGEYAAREGGSDALRENIRGRAMFQMHYPATPSVYLEIDPKQAICMNRLIGWGRYGNQLLEYFWLHLHAMNHGLTLAVPYWLGRDLFGLADPILNNAKEFTEKSENDLPMEHAISPSGPSLAGLNIKGFCQINTQYTAPYKSVFRALFRPIEPLESALNGFLEQVKASSKKLIAVHIRRTDYVGSEYDIGSVGWYQSWLRAMGAEQPHVQVYIASDDPKTVTEFAEFNAVSNRDYPFTILGAEFLPDWWVLAHADSVAISNSTFSLTAAMFNSALERSESAYRPSEGHQSLQQFEPWNTQVLDVKQAKLK